VATLAGLFNPQPDISKQYKTGAMKNALNFDFMRDQTVIKHTAGTFSSGTVKGANQTGQTLVTNAITGTLNIGDIITIAGVTQVNRITKQTTGALRQFVITANAAGSATSLSIYPAIVPSGAGGVAVQYQTVVNSPADGAAISLFWNASATFRKNIAYAPEFVTLAFADLELPGGVHEVARESFDNVSMRMLTAYAVGTDQLITRLDTLYGYLYVRPEWGVVLCDAI
jgi:P22 coat protein - gene protein 5